jgi:hypothetical protein
MTQVWDNKASLLLLPSQQPAADRSLTAMHGLTSLDLGSREPYMYNATWGHPLRTPHTYHTPTHPSQSSPLSPGKISVTDGWR